MHDWQATLQWLHWHVTVCQCQGIKLDFIGSFSMTTAAKMDFSFLDGYENRHMDPDPEWRFAGHTRCWLRNYLTIYHGSDAGWDIIL